MVVMRRFLLVALLCVAAFEFCTAEVYWRNCNAKADHPPMAYGNFHNLCIKNHEFKSRNFAWLLSEAVLENVEFKGCTFSNTGRGVTNFTSSVFTDVRFNDCVFGSFTPNPIRLTHIKFKNVEFKNTVFHKTAKLIFQDFEFHNVTFTNCRFESDSLFSKGQLISVNFNGCAFKRSPNAKTVSGDDIIRFDHVRMVNSGFLKSHFITPLMFQAVNAADMNFNHTKFGQFWCHDRPASGAEPKYYSRFNDSMFQDVTFEEAAYCDATTWSGFSLFNGTFKSNADFSYSVIRDMFWDTVEMTRTFKGQCNTLDFSNSKILRKAFHRVSVRCEVDFRDASIEKLNIKEFNSGRGKARFQGVVFTGQEYIDGKCCMNVCKKLGCQCNITSPSRSCKDAGYPVNYNAAWFCFPADARVSTLQGTVRMDELEHGHRVAVGDGQHSDVYFFGHRSRWQTAKFVEIWHDGPASPLRISEEHYLYANGRLVTAQNVRVGDKLKNADGEPLVVSAISTTRRQGLYAPTSLHGDLIVDGVRVSSYTSVVHPRLAHFLLNPLRLLHRVGLSRVVRQFNMFEKRSWEHIPRALGVPRGPETIEL